jgi:hypothetical protein
VKKDEIGIGITDAGSLSLKAGEGAGVYTTKYKRVVEKTRLLRYLTCPYSFRLDGLPSPSFLRIRKRWR